MTTLRPIETSPFAPVASAGAPCPICARGLAGADVRVSSQGKLVRYFHRDGRDPCTIESPPNGV